MFAATDDVLARAAGRPGPHLQPRPRHPAVDAGRARAGARAVRASQQTSRVHDQVRVRSSLMTRVGVLPDGARHAVVDGRDAGVPDAGARRTPAVARARRRDAPNYDAIGGRSPLTDLTLAQAAALRARLGADIPVAVGMRNWKPFIKDALAELAARRRDARHRHSAGAAVLDAQRAEVLDAATAALPAGIALEPIESFHAHPLLIEAFAERVRDARPQARRGVIFTAHASRSASSRRATATPTRSPRPRAAVAARAGPRDVRPRVPERRAHAGAVDRPGAGRS